MLQNDSVVAICSSDKKVRQAVRKLQQSGFDIDRFSIVTRSVSAGADVADSCNGGEPVKKRIIPAGTTILRIPDIGTVAVEGPLISAIAEGREANTTESEVSLLGAGLQRCGIPRSNVASYETAVKSRNRLVIVQCAAGECVKAKEILAPLKFLDIAVHHV